MPGYAIGRIDHPVVYRPEGQPHRGETPVDVEYGIVLLSDVARKVLAKDRAPDRVNIYEIMSTPVIGVDPEMDIRYCTQLFDWFGLSYAPVIDKGELKGIVSYASMVLRGLCRLAQGS